MKLLISGLAIGGFAITSVAANLYVPSILYPTIASAMLNANFGDSIVLYADPNPRAEPQVVLREGVSIVGASSDRSDVTIYPAGDYTLFVATDLEETASIKSLTVNIPTGRSNSRALSATSSSVALENIYINGCVASAEGGAIRAFDCELTLTDFTIWGSAAGGSAGVNHGGGIWAYSTYLSMSNGTIGGCEAVDGAGLYFVGVDVNVTPTFDLGFEMEYVDFLGNIATGDGGGAWLGEFYSGGTHLIHGSVTTEITDNSAGDLGGGFYMADGSVDIDSLNFQYNDAVYGGGLYCANSLQLTDAAFRGNTARYKGGGAYLQGGTLINTNFIENEAMNTSTGNQLNGGGLYSEANALTLTNCEFRSNTVSVEADGSPVSRTAMGGGVFVEDGILSAQNCLFNLNTIEAAGTATYHLAFGGAVYAADDASFEQCTFALNATSADAAGMQIGGSAIASFGSLELLMCNISDNVSSDTAQGQVYQNSGNHDIDVTYTNVTGSLENDWVGVLAGHLQDTGNLNVESRFVDTEANDFRLKWNSPLMDAGLFSTSNLDFDLTTKDIGWQKSYVTQTLSSGSSNLAPGRYEVNNAVTVTLSAGDLVLEPDVMIRLSQDAILVLKDPNNGGSITIGDAAGARTALVGARSLTTNMNQLGNAIVIGNKEATAQTELILGGVLFNMGTPTLEISFCEINMVGEQNPTEQTCEFRNHRVTMISVYSCTGTFSDMAFDPWLTGALYPLPGLTSLYIQYSDLDLMNLNMYEGNVGVGTPSYYNILVYGTSAFPTSYPGFTELNTCQFLGSTDYTPGYFSNCYFLATEAGLTGNTFLEGRDRAFMLLNADVHMGADHGQNTLVKLVNEDYVDPLILHQGTSELDLFCGYNVFVHPQSESDDYCGFVQSTVTSGPTRTDWQKNYWGTSVENDLDDLDACNSFCSGCDIPGWVTNYTPMLSTPYPSVVPCDIESPSEIYALALDMLSVHNHRMAWGYFHTLTLEYPDSSEASLSAAHMKSIGLNTSWGQDNSPELTANLLQAADSAWSAQPSLGFSEATYAWVIEGKHGDSQTALAELDTLLAACTTGTDSSIVSIGIAEVESFPGQGGMSSLGNGQAVRSAVQKQRTFAHDVVATFLPGGAVPAHTEDVVLPVGFDLGPAVPNPFNPVTILALQVQTEGHYQARLYNLQGQLVRMLLDEELRAGSHTLRVDGTLLASGAYFVETHGPQGQLSRKVTLLK